MTVWPTTPVADTGPDDDLTDPDSPDPTDTAESSDAALTSPQPQTDEPLPPINSADDLSFRKRLWRTCGESRCVSVVLSLWSIVEVMSLALFSILALSVANEFHSAQALLDLEPQLRLPVLFLLVATAGKIVLVLSEIVLSVAWGGRAVHPQSLPILLLLQALWEPLFLDIPILFTLYQGSCYFRSRVFQSPIGIWKLAIGLVHIIPMAFKWTIQLGVAANRGKRAMGSAGFVISLAVICVAWNGASRGRCLFRPGCSRAAVEEELVVWDWTRQLAGNESVMGKAFVVIELDLKTQEELDVIKGLATEQNPRVHSSFREMMLCSQPLRIGQRNMAMFLLTAWPKWENLLSDNAIPFIRHDSSAIDLLLREFRNNAGRRRLTPLSSSTHLTFDKYYPYQEIMWHLEALEREFPHLVTLMDIGRSVEGRPIIVTKLGDPDVDDTARFWLDCGIHAREWISPATCIFVISEVLKGMREKKSGNEYKIQWFILPIFNPDGYAWTWSSLRHRFWRKNRSMGAEKAQEAGVESACVGVDLNRNFDWAWGNPEGCSPDPCAPVFCGPSAFSEPETAAVRDFLLGSNMTTYVSLHSYSQMWFVPFGHELHNYSSDHELLVSFPFSICLFSMCEKEWDVQMRVGREAVAALESVHGTRFVLGSAPELMYKTSGDSSDWAKGVAGVRLSFGVELRPGHCWIKHQFLLPASEIRPTGEETWAALAVVARHSRALVATEPTSDTLISP